MGKAFLRNWELGSWDNRSKEKFRSLLRSE
jgi:hypothetical protein